MQPEKGLYEINELLEHRKESGRAYFEFLRVPAMTAGVYVLAAGSQDAQKPHRQDELYYVVRGRARMSVQDQDREIAAGSVIFVAAEVEHRFHDIREELVVLVVFAPAES